MHQRYKTLLNEIDSAYDSNFIGTENEWAIELHDKKTSEQKWQSNYYSKKEGAIQEAHAYCKSTLKSFP
jgi:hypothetical protein